MEEEVRVRREISGADRYNRTVAVQCRGGGKRWVGQAATSLIGLVLHEICPTSPQNDGEREGGRGDVEAVRSGWQRCVMWP